MKKTQGKSLMAAGIALLLAAFLLTGYNWNQNARARESTQNILTQLKAQMPASHTETSDTLSAQMQSGAEDLASADAATSPFAENTSLLPQTDLYAEYLSDAPVSSETVWWVEGESYLGTISIPTLGLELPVLSQWSYPNLRIAPCRYAGSVEEGNLILAAHNYNCHFGLISRLNSGDSIFFTDGDGLVHAYTVVETEWISGGNTSEMLAGSDAWDLTLFTCTLSGTSRVTVRAVSASEAP
jgi:sortase A